MAGFRTRNYELKTRKRKAGSRLTFALLADLHNKEYGPDNTRLIEAIRKQQPDAILIAGDMLIGHTKMPFFRPRSWCWLFRKSRRSIMQTETTNPVCGCRPEFMGRTTKNTWSL